MLNTHHESSHSRSREDRVRAVPVGTTEARSRRVETLGGLSGPRMRGGRNTPAPSEYGPARGRNPTERSPQGDETRPAFFPFGQQNVLHRTPVESPLPTGPASSVLPPPSAPNEQLVAQVQGLEHMMQQMVLQQQTFMQTMTASFQQQQQSVMQAMEASMQQQLQLLRQQASSSVPAPPVVQGAPGSVHQARLGPLHHLHQGTLKMSREMSLQNPTSGCLVCPPLTLRRGRIGLLKR